MSDFTPSRRSSFFNRVFLDHPAKVDETYFEHLVFALSFCFWLAVAAGAALVHAIVPALFETTASRILRKLTARTEARH